MNGISIRRDGIGYSEKTLPVVVYVSPVERRAYPGSGFRQVMARFQARSGQGVIGIFYP